MVTLNEAFSSTGCPSHRLFSVPSSFNHCKLTNALFAKSIDHDEELIVHERDSVQAIVEVSVKSMFPKSYHVPVTVIA